MRMTRLPPCLNPIAYVSGKTYSQKKIGGFVYVGCGYEGVREKLQPGLKKPELSGGEYYGDKQEDPEGDEKQTDY
jgi:hypothetical protein